MVCPVDCIHPRPDEPDYAKTEMLYIDPTTCIDCGMCAEECPVDAIYRDDSLSAETQAYAQINADYSADRPPLGPVKARFTPVIDVAEHLPMRVAVVGSGPSGCYTAIELLNIASVEVDIYDRLPTPWGLARAGVAPDHLDTKGVTRSFAEHAGNPRLRFLLHVEIGREVSDSELGEYYDAIIYATGASESHTLGIPGEDLRGSVSATEFVGWYNGHPDHADWTFDFNSLRVVIVGNGNVALDMARLLTVGEVALRESDIAQHALDALRRSRIREVVVIGRRSAAQAACTSPELLALGDIPEIAVKVRPEDLALTEGEKRQLKQSVSARRRYELFKRYAARGARSARTIEFRFLESPERLVGHSSVEAIVLGRNRMHDAGDKTIVQPTGLWYEIKTSLVIRSIGYRAAEAPQLPFDVTTGVALNAMGRIIRPHDRGVVPGRYVVGWIKRGSSGSLGTNKECARQTVGSLLEDLRTGSLPRATGSRMALDLFLERRCPDLVSWREWRLLDRHEQQLGRQLGRPRLKLVDTGTMVDLTRAQSSLDEAD